MIGGADVSGDLISGNHKDMGFVVCTEKYIANVEKTAIQLGVDLYSRKQVVREFIASHFEFDGIQSMAFCLRIERNATFKKLKIKNEPKILKPTHKKFFHAYHYRHFKTMRGRLEEFLSKHGYELTSLPVECDGDCRGFVTNVGLRPRMPGHAHKIADAIAWANNRGRVIPGVIEIDEWDQIATDLARRFKRAVLT